MRSPLRPTLMAGLSLSFVLTGGAGPATAQDADCARDVLAMPVETMELPEGWTWHYLQASAWGAWTMTLNAVEAGESYVELEVHCIPDANAYWDASERVRQSGLDMGGSDEGSEVTVVPVGDIGDKVVALERNLVRDGYPEYSRDISWIHGDDMLGRVWTYHKVDWTLLEDVALTLDAMLP